MHGLIQEGLFFPLEAQRGKHVLCCRSARVAPLVQCDYCPLLFHMDCLDPPLSVLPSQRWMCPNHVEHAVVSNTWPRAIIHRSVRIQCASSCGK